MKLRRALLLTALPLWLAAPPSRGDSAAADDLEARLREAAPTIRGAALHAAVSAWNSLAARGEAIRPLLTVIDYGLPSTAKRLWVFDLSRHRLLFHDLVAHGRNSGDDLAEIFSNEDGSHMSSLGAFETGDSYEGRNGYSLRLRGLDPGLNDRAEARAIVMHGAPYVCEEVATALGRLGRSFGCPAVRSAIARELIDAVKDRTLLYVWHPLLETGAAADCADDAPTPPASGARP